MARFLHNEITIMRTPALVLIACTPVVLLAQAPNPTQTNDSASPDGSTPIFRVQVVSRSIAAVSYRNRSGWTKINFTGTALAPKAHGDADVDSELGDTHIKVDIKSLPSPQTYGSQYLTYTLWAISPEGQASNLGEVVTDNDGNFKQEFTTHLQAFGLIVTAEPYFDVQIPSDVVVMENIIRSDTKGKWETINANYQLLPRGTYLYHVPESQQHPVDLQNKKNPLYLDEAQNAVQIARYARADQFAGDIFQDAIKLLNQAESYQSRKEWKPANMTAKEAVQKAESARLISLKTQQQDALNAERQAAAEREAAAKAQAAAANANAAQEAQAAQAATEQRQQALALAQQEAEERTAAQKAEQEAQAARAEAAEQARKAQASAEEANRLRDQAVQQREQLRQQLLQQFNSILQTRETARGLVINMSDVLFAVNKFNLTEDARLKLARLSGIILAHPGLNLRVEGYTDSTGTESYNEKLSNERADSVRDFLLSQGLTPDQVTAMGYGEQYPVASNDTSAGRAMNRRVQIVVSGEIIGFQIGTPPAPAGPDSNAPGAGGQVNPNTPQQQPQPQPMQQQPPPQQPQQPQL